MEKGLHWGSLQSYPGKLERRQHELLHPFDEATTILLEALQELCLDVLLHKKIGLALFFSELLHCSRDDDFLVDL